MAAARRWALFAISLASLTAMSYAGVLLAFSVRVTPEMLEANPDLSAGGRAVLARSGDPSAVSTHAQGAEGALLVAGDRAGSLFPSSARNVSMARALLYVDASALPGNVTLVNVPSSNGTSNFTLDPAALANGTAGWVVMGAGESEPRFLAAGEVLGHVSQLVSGVTLGVTFALGLLGFAAPLVVLVVTHRPSRRGAPAGGMCGECGSVMPASSAFCLRCGAYRSGD